MTKVESMSFEEFSRKEALKRLIEEAERVDKEEKEKLKAELEKLREFLELK